MTFEVQLIQTSFQEKDIIQFARISNDDFDSTQYLADNDKCERLFWFLLRKPHPSPFHHPQITFKITASLDVRAQLDTHKVGIAPPLAINSMSYRYVAPTGLDEIELRAKVKDKKQGSGDVLADEAATASANEHAQKGLALYNELLGKGIAPETARRVLSEATLTTWACTGSLWAMVNLIAQRTAPDAQKETRLVALEMKRLLEQQYPFVFQCLEVVWFYQRQLEALLDTLTVADVKKGVDFLPTISFNERTHQQ